MLTPPRLRHLRTDRRGIPGPPPLPPDRTGQQTIARLRAAAKAELDIAIAAGEVRPPAPSPRTTYLPHHDQVDDDDEDIVGGTEQASTTGQETPL